MAIFSGASLRVPTNSHEACFALSFVVFGILFGSTLISAVASMSVDFQLAQREKRGKLEMLRSFLQQHKIPVGVASHVRTQVARRLGTEKIVSKKDVGVLNLLSAADRDILWVEIYSPILLTNTLLRISDYMDDQVTTELATNAVHWTAVDAGEKLFIPGKDMIQAFCILTGSITYTPQHFRPSRRLLKVKKTSSLRHWRHGDQAGPSRNNGTMDPQELLPLDVCRGTWLCELALWCMWVTQGWAESVTSVELLELKARDLESIVSYHPEVARIAQDYSIALCNFLQRPDLRLSDIRKYADINEETLICALPQDTRTKISEPAMEAVYEAAGQHEARLRSAHLLKDEVASGKCWLGTDPVSGKVLRVVNVVTLNLTRGDRCTCKKIGEWDSDQQIVVRCKSKPPGTKMRPGELPRQTLDRLLHEEFPAMNIRVSGLISERTEIEPSEKYLVSSKYVVIEFNAEVLDSVDDMLVIKVSQSVLHVESFTIGEEISDDEDQLDLVSFELRCEAGNKKVGVYAWFPSIRTMSMAFA